MTNPVPVPAFGTPPAAPNPNNRPTYNADRAAMNFWMLGLNSTAGSNMVGLAQSASTNALSASESAVAAAAAAAGANVELWDAATVYSVGVVVISPAALAAGPVSVTYVCKAATGSTHIDPYSDPTHWAIFSVSGGTGGAVYTTSTTLTSGSPFAIKISGKCGAWIKLPDATTLQTGARYSICNAGADDVRVLDAAGSVMGFIRPRDAVAISCADASTPAGGWIHGLEETGITQRWQALPMTLAVNNIKASVRIDSDRVMFLIGGQSGSQLHAVVWSDAAGGIGATYLVRASAYHANAVLCGAGQVMVVSADNSTFMQGVVLTVTGTSIAAGTVSSATLSLSCTGIGQLIATPTGFALSFVMGSSGCVRGLAISGGAPVFGSENILATSYANGATDIPKLYLSGNVVRTVRANSSIEVKPFTANGAQLTAGTGATTSGGLSFYKHFLLGNGNIVVFRFSESTGYAVVHFVKLSGTTETIYSYTFSRLYATPNSDYFEIKPVGTNKVAAFFHGMYAYAPNNREFVGVLLTDNHGSASASAEYNRVIHNNGVPIAILGNNTSAIVSVFLGSYVLTFNCTSSMQLSRVVQVNQSMPTPASSGLTRSAELSANASACANASGTYLFSNSYPVVRKYNNSGDVYFIGKYPLSIPATTSVRGENELSAYTVDCHSNENGVNYGITVTRIEVCSN